MRARRLGISVFGIVFWERGELDELARPPTSPAPATSRLREAQVAAEADAVVLGDAGTRTRCRNASASAPAAWGAAALLASSASSA